MNRISKLFKALTLIAKQPSLLNKVLDDHDVNKNAVIAEHGLSHGLPVINIAELLPGLNETVDPFCFLDGGSTPIDLALLKGLARRKEKCEYFEIGTWRGESAANVASVAQHCTTLNLPDDEMLAMGLSKKYVGLHRFFSKDIRNITHLQGNSLKYDYTALNKKFDLVFIDGDHHYESVMQDTRNAFRLLRDDNAVIVWHDYGSNPNDIRWDVLRGILEGTPSEKRKYLYRVSNTLCAIYINTPLKSVRQESIETPDKRFIINIQSGTVTS
ncbi:MAG TPA: class I SAM-dependent methyltransferase [Bacteroidia bacterium]|jgi:predicted O-methyltransferase YrrM